MKIDRKATALFVAIGLGGAVALTSSTAFAFGGGHGPRGMKGPHGAMMQMEFADVDLNKDGQITIEDLQAFGKARFDEADADGDGELTAEEMVAQMDARMQAAAAMETQDGAAQTPLQKKGGRFGKAMSDKQRGWMAEEMISRRDADKNGSLSFEEMSPETARMERMIDRFDTDDDNAISQAEFDAAQKEMFLNGRHGMGGKGDRHGKGSKGHRG